MHLLILDALNPQASYPIACPGSWMCSRAVFWLLGKLPHRNVCIVPWKIVEEVAKLDYFVHEQPKPLQPTQRSESSRERTYPIKVMPNYIFLIRGNRNHQSPIKSIRQSRCLPTRPKIQKIPQFNF